MSKTGLSLIGLIGLLTTVATAAAAPPAPSFAGPGIAVQVAARCVWGFHRNRRGHCAVNRHSYYRPRAYWPRHYGDGHEPWNQPGPTDHVANQLNRQQRRGGGYRSY